MADPILNRLAALVRALRLTLNLTIEDAAATAGIDRATWSEIESAEHDPTYLQTLAMARALTVPAVVLFETHETR